MAKIYKIYISSTSKDLEKEREAAAQGVRRLGHQSVYMKDCVSSPQFPVDKCLQDVRSCDFYVGIFAWRYGFIPNGYDKSITHLEYEAAKKAGVPRLIFLLDQKASWPVEYVATKKERKKIERLRKKLENEYTLSFFKNADELSGMVTAAVSVQISMVERSFIKFKRPEDLIGTKLGKYEIREKLGSGGKGVVFKVLDTLEESTKAIKMVPPSISESPLAFKHLKQELKNADRIIHPNVVKVLGLEEYDGNFFIVMEYIDGKSLEQLLADSKERKLKETEVIDIMRKMAQGLLEVHKKDVIHRDIKPSNVMVTPDGQVKILDFGISYQVTKSMTELVGEHQSMGTWPYMAPEQFFTKYGRENQQVDIWGFGVTMYQLLTGQFPFINKDQIKDKNEKPYEMAGISRRTRNLVMKCLEKDRKKRFQNMEEVLKALNAIPKGKVKTKEKVKPKERVTTRLKWSLVAASIIVLIVFLVFFIFPLIQGDKTDPKDPNDEVFKQLVIQARECLENKNFECAREKLQKAEEIEKTEETERIKQDILIEDARECLKIEDFEKARAYLTKAEKIKKTKETGNIWNDINRKEFDYYFSKAKDSYSEGKYTEALEFISDAEKIKITDGLKELKDLKNKILERLEDDRAFEEAKAQDTIPAYQAYLDKYKDGRHRSEAEKKIRELKKGQRPAFVTAVEKIAKKVYKNDSGFWEADYGDEIIMVYIPAGEFKMGSKDFKEATPHDVYLDSYWIGKTQVTNAQYVIFLNDSRIARKYKMTHIKGKRGKYYIEQNYEKHPVIEVNWNEVRKYCKWLSEKKGLNFKLPTEAQWEKAARGSDGRKYPWGNHEPYYEGKWYANYAPYDWGKRGEDGYKYTAPVSSYPHAISPYGLMDMAGNVWEWCNDWYWDAFYKSAPKKNPTGPGRGRHRVVRGGDWNGGVMFIRCAFRFRASPSHRFEDIGFRLAQEDIK